MANSPLTLSELVRAERSGALSADDTGVTPEADPEPLLLAEDKAAADGQSAPGTDPAADFHGAPFSLGGQGTDGNDHIPRGRWWNFIYGDDADNIIEMVDSYGYDEDGRQILTTGHHVNEVYGGAGNDILQGNSGKDWLYGQDGNDIIHGGGNRDILEGGYGDDVIYGDADDEFDLAYLVGNVSG